MSDRKRQRLDSATTELPVCHLSALNDDCILEIFKKLDLNQLCAIAQTCKKLRLLAGEHFQRRYPYIIIEVFGIGGVGLSSMSNMRHANCFSRAVQNLSIEHTFSLSTNGETKYNLPIYLRSRFSNALKSITFAAGDFSNSLGDQISNLLQNVETVTFHSNLIPLQEIFYENVLYHCQRIKRIECDNGYLPTSTYPTLEEFQLMLDSDNGTDKQQTMDKLIRFFQLNPNIKEFIWMFRNKNDHDVAEHIQLFNETIGNLCNLHLDLKYIAANDSIKRLEENLNPEILTKLTINWPDNLTPIIDSLHKFTNLTHLCMTGDFGVVPKTKWFCIAKALQNLQEMYIVDTCYKLLFDDDDDNIDEIVFSFNFTPFVRFSPNLYKLTVLCKCDFNVDQITFLNDERKKLGSACKILIQIPKRYHVDQMRLLNRQNSLLEIY